MHADGGITEDRWADVTKVIDAFPDCTNAPTKELLLTFVHTKLGGFHFYNMGLQPSIGKGSQPL